jgi:hypothetical protein
MTEITTLTEMLKQYGPMGVAVLLMGLGLIYQTRWLRDMQDKAAVQQDKARAEFTQALKDQREEHTASLREVVNEFKEMHKDLGEKVDGMRRRLDDIDEHIRGK